MCDRRGSHAGLSLALAALLVLSLAVPGAVAAASAGDGSAAGSGGVAPTGARVDILPDPGSSDGPGELPTHRPATTNRTATPQADSGSESSPHRALEPGERRRVTLVTGETVTLSLVDGELSIEAVEGGSVGIARTNERVYLLPTDVDLGTYDRSLFALETLLTRGTDEGTSVLLSTDSPLDPANETGLTDVRYLRSAGVVAARVDAETRSDTLADLVADGRVERVSIDRRFDRATVPAAAASPPPPRRNVTGEGVTVAVLDTGIDATHPDLAGRVLDRYDLVAEVGDGGEPADESPLDPQGHGTHVAGVLAGTGAASDGRVHAGVAPGAKLLDVRVLNERGVGQSSTIVGGIERAVEADADVILLSVGSGVDGSEAIARSVEWAAEQGAIVVAAAGNNGRPRSIGAPGRPRSVITVGGFGDDGRVAGYSSQGPTLDGRLKPDLVAPSGGIVGPRVEGAGRAALDDDGRYTRTSGTSVAAPQVAGAVALLLEGDPDLTAREAKNRLASAARPVGGAGAYAHGSGVLDVDGTLDADVVAHDAVVDFGLVADDGTRNRTIVLENRDDRRRDLTLETSVRNVDLDRPADDSAWLNRTELSLAPGERAAVALTIDGNTTSGAHAGTIRYSVSGEPRTIAFGFVRGGTVTVEKRPLTAGDDVDGDELWVLTEEGTHDELLQFEDGSASFVAGGGTYVLWSTGYDEASDTIVFLSERRTVDGPTHVVLNESRTAPVGVDVGSLVDRHGRLENRSVIASMSTEYASGLARRSVSRADLDGRAVRVSRDPKIDVATTFLLAAGGSRNEGLDAPDVFQLAHGVEGVDGPSVVEVDADDLETTEYRHHRRTVDETFRARDRSVIDGIWNHRETRWFGLGDRTVQRIHRLRGAATYERRLRGEGWTARDVPSNPGEEPLDVLAHPMHALVDVSYDDSGRVSVSGAPFADGGGTRFDPVGEHNLTAVVDGDVVRTERLTDGGGSFPDVPVEPGKPFTVRLTGENGDGWLSTRTLTEVTVPAYRPPEARRPWVTDRPPTITDLAVADASAANAVEPGETTLSVDFDVAGPLVDSTVWYANGSPSAPPWENDSAWVEADVEPFPDQLRATVTVGDAAETVSVAAELEDVRDRRVRTMTADAFHVGAAPNASTSTIVGRLVAADGTPAGNDTLVLQRVEGDARRYVGTDEHGGFEVEVPKTHRYDLLYVRGGPWGPPVPVEDDRPAWAPLGRLDAAEDVELGVIALPAANELTVDVRDERGEPVSGATVRLRQRWGDGSIWDRLVTNGSGVAGPRGVEAPGLQLAGTVELIVTPPGTSLYPDRTYARTVTLDEPASVNVTLETAPPRAVIRAFGTFEPGTDLFLHARRSEVPAGAVEYRWDVDGDGQVDEVTRKPRLRYAPPTGTSTPSVTVVDAAGKTDTSSLTIHVGEG